MDRLPPRSTLTDPLFPYTTLFRAVQAAPQLRRRGRQDEHADEVVARRLAQLLGALPVDVEWHVAAALQRGLHRRARRAVVVAEHHRMLQQLAARNHRGEALLPDEEVVLALRQIGRAHV